MIVLFLFSTRNRILKIDIDKINKYKKILRFFSAVESPAIELRPKKLIDATIMIIIVLAKLKLLFLNIFMKNYFINYHSFIFKLLC